MTRAERSAAALGEKGKAEATRKKTTDCWPTQLMPAWRRGEHAVSKAGRGGDGYEDEAGVAGDHADEGRGPDAERDQDHGEDFGLVNELLGAKADGEGSAGGDHARAWLVESDAEEKTDRHREDEDEVGAEGLRAPVEEIAFR